MKKITLATFFTFLLVLASQAQSWTRMHGWGLDLESIHWVNDQKVFAVGENLIIYSDNAGTTWKEVEQKFDTRFFDLVFINESIGIAVGEEGKIYRSINGGVTWEKVESGEKGLLKSINLTGTNQIIISGENGVLLTSFDSGNTWNSIPTNTSLGLQDGFILNEKTWFFTAEEGSLLRSFDKGLTYEKIKLNTSEKLNGIVFTNALLGYVVGDRGTFFRTTDGGNTWNFVNTNVTTSLKKVTASPLDSRIIIAAGEGATLIRTTNSGSTFSKINLGATNTRNIHALAFRPGTSQIYSVGQNGYIIFSTNSGGTWATRAAGIRNDFSSVDFLTPTVGYISGLSSQIYVTTNAATSLTLRPIPDQSAVLDIEFWNNSTGFASSTSGKVFRTSNSGSTWIPIPLSTTNDIQGFHLFSASSIYVVGTTGFISKTTNSGTIWDQSINSGTLTDLKDLSFFDNNIGFAIGNNGLISRTIGGAIWETQEKITEENLNALAKLDTESAIIVGDNGIVLKTKNKAVSWEILPFPEKIKLTSVDFFNKDLGFIVGEKGTSYQTVNGGSTWFKINTGTIRDLLSVNFGDPKSAFAVGKDGTILSYSCTAPSLVGPISGNVTDCIGTSIYTINSSPEPGSEIVWRVDGGNIISGQGTSTLEVEWTKSGRNAIFVNRANFCGIGEISALEVLVNQIPNIPTSIAGDGSVCIETNSTYSLPNQSGITYTWEVSGGEILSGQGTSAVVIRWISTGDQKVSVIASNDCGKSPTITKQIRSTKAPDQPAEIQGETIIPIGQAKYQTTAVDGLNYRWSILGNGKIIAGQGTASITVSWEIEGKFELSVEAQNECNFGPKRVLPVTVNVITALELNPLPTDLIVYPNPSQGKLILQSSHLDSFEKIRVVNSLGQTLYLALIEIGSTQHEIFDLPKGIHLIWLSGRNGATTKKVIIN